MKPYRISAPRPPTEVEETKPTLGVKKSHHAGSKSSRILIFLAPMAVAVAPIVVLATSGEPFNGFMVGVITFLTLLAAAIGWFITPTKVTAVDLHEGGLVLLGRKRVELCFDDVDEVWLRTYPGESQLVRSVHLKGVRLVSNDKREVFIASEIQGFDVLLKRIDRACTYPLIAPAEAALAAGEVLTFGKVRIDSESITVGKKRHLWSDIKLTRLQVDRAALFVSQRIVPWRIIAWSEVPHPQLFFRLFKRLAPNQVEEAGVRFGF